VPESLTKVKPAELADEIESKYPYAPITGFAVEASFNCLYRLCPKEWLSDAAIGAVFERECATTSPGPSI
jgi:hypothetical protein